MAYEKDLEIGTLCYDKWDKRNKFDYFIILENKNIDVPWCGAYTKNHISTYFVYGLINQNNTFRYKTSLKKLEK